MTSATILLMKRKCCFVTFATVATIYIVSDCGTFLKVVGIARHVPDVVPVVLGIQVVTNSGYTSTELMASESVCMQLLCAVPAYSFGARATTAHSAIAVTKTPKRLVLWSTVVIAQRRRIKVCTIRF